MTATHNRRMKKYAEHWVKDVSREPAQHHVRDLRAQGMGDADIAEAAGCTRNTITELRRGVLGRQLIDPDLSRRILAVRAPSRGHLPRPGWTEDAACKGDPGPWVCEISRMTHWRHAQQAPQRDRWKRQRAICAECPVKDDCLADAVDWEMRRRKQLHPWQIDVSIRAGLLPHELQDHVDKLMGIK